MGVAPSFHQRRGRRSRDTIAGNAAALDETTADDTETAFDPWEHTVAEVQAYLDEHPDEYHRVMALERDGKNRVTLTGDE